MSNIDALCELYVVEVGVETAESMRKSAFACNIDENLLFLSILTATLLAALDIQDDFSLGKSCVSKCRNETLKTHYT